MEEGLIKFSKGKFGQRCDKDAAKKRLKRYKHTIRRLINTEPDAYWRQIQYLRHRRRLEEIDEAKPLGPQVHLNTNHVVNVQSNNFNRAQLLQSRLDRANAHLLVDIHKIYTRTVHLEENPAMNDIVNRHWKKRMQNTLHIGLENCLLYQRLQEIKPIVPSHLDYHQWYKEMCKYRLLCSKFPPYWTTRICSPFEEVAWQRARDVPRPIVYIDLEIADKAIGRVVFELRADLVPMTAENFRSLCAGDRGPSYRCTEITLVLNGLFWQGGAGVTSIYGETFPNENYKIKHDSEGILSMVSYGEKTTNSEFRIAATALPPLNGKQVAFGKVILGMTYLNNIMRIADVTERGKPLYKIVVTSCGETNLDALTTMPPPISVKEQQIISSMKAMEVSLKTGDEDQAKGKYKDLPLTPSYSGLTSRDNKGSRN